MINLLDTGLSRLMGCFGIAYDFSWETSPSFNPPQFFEIRTHKSNISTDHEIWLGRLYVVVSFECKEDLRRKPKEA